MRPNLPPVSVGPRQAAELIGQSHETVHRLIKSGDLPAKRTPGGRLLITLDALKQWVDQLEDA